MRPLALASLVALALAAAAPGAAAVVMDTTTSVEVAPYAERLTQDVASIPVRVTYTYTLGVATVPTAISLHLAEIPPYLTATLSPSTVYVDVVHPVHAVGVSVTREAYATMLVSGNEDLPSDAAAVLKVAAHAHANGDLKPSSGATSTLLKTAVRDDEPCHHEEAAPAPAEPTTVETQSAAVLPLGSPLVAAFALAGLAAGAYAAVRRARP